MYIVFDPSVFSRRWWGSSGCRGCGGAGWRPVQRRPPSCGGSAGSSTPRGPAPSDTPGDLPLPSAGLPLRHTGRIPPLKTHLAAGFCPHTVGNSSVICQEAATFIYSSVFDHLVAHVLGLAIWAADSDVTLYRPAPATPCHAFPPPSHLIGSR